MGEFVTIWRNEEKYSAWHKKLAEDKAAVLVALKSGRYEAFFNGENEPVRITDDGRLFYEITSEPEYYDGYLDGWYFEGVFFQVNVLDYHFQKNLLDGHWEDFDTFDDVDLVQALDALYEQAGPVVCYDGKGDPSMPKGSQPLSWGDKY